MNELYPGIRPSLVTALSASGTTVDLVREADGSIRISWIIGGLVPVAKWFEPEEARKIADGILGLLGDRDGG